MLGSLNDGLGNGADQLFLKSALDGFAAIAFAASLGWGVGASVLALLVVQGSLTALGAVLGDVLPAAQVAALTATGGLMLVGVALRLLRIKQLPVGDLLPGLLVAPLLTDPRRGAPLSRRTDGGAHRPTRCEFVAPNLATPRVGPSVTVARGCGSGASGVTTGNHAVAIVPRHTETDRRSTPRQESHARPPQKHSPTSAARHSWSRRS